MGSLSVEMPKTHLAPALSNLPELAPVGQGARLDHLQGAFKLYDLVTQREAVLLHVTNARHSAPTRPASDT